jgi:hypothetical protein
MKLMAEKYQQFTGDPPTTICKSLTNNMPPSPTSSWDIRSQIRRVVSDQVAVINDSWEFTRNANPLNAERIYGEFSSSDWLQRADHNCPEIRLPQHNLCPVSISIDGAHLDQIGRMCVEPVIM